MAGSKIIRRDISHQPDALSKAIHAPELRSALLACGFHSIGCVEILAPGMLTLKQASIFMDDADAAYLVNALENGEVDEILASQDGNAFAVVERHFGGPVVSFMSITENGTIIETTMKPDRAPKASKAFLGSSRTTPLNFLSQALALRLRISFGTPPLWPRPNRPQAGYLVELVETRQVSYLWSVHLDRLQNLAGPEQQLPAHSTLGLYDCIKNRSDQITEHIGKWTRILGSVNLVVSFVIAILLAIEIVGLIWLFFPDLEWYWGLLPILALASLASAIPALGSGFIRMIVLPGTPGPKLVTVSALMASNSWKAAPPGDAP